MVDGKQDPPVSKLMDFNRERFKKRQREKEVEKRQVERRRLDDLKEVRFSTRTEPNDLDLKAQMARQLLQNGQRVKLAIIPHGNDELEPKGRDMILRVVTMLQETCSLKAGPRVEKQRVWVLLRPTAFGDKSGANEKKCFQSNLIHLGRMMLSLLKLTRTRVKGTRLMVHQVLSRS